MTAVVQPSGAGALVLVAFVLAAARWGTWRTIRRTLELVALLGVAATALVALLGRRRVTQMHKANRYSPDEDDRAFEAWQHERWRVASKRESVEGYGRGFGGKG